MRNGRGQPNARRPGVVGRMVCRFERRLLGLGMRGIAVFADRQLSRYHEREAAEPGTDAEPGTVR